MYPELFLLKRNELDIKAFKAMVTAAWEALDQAKINRLVDSMERRLRAVRKVRGWYTKY